jgi:hypothetical protein
LNDFKRYLQQTEPEQPAKTNTLPRTWPFSKLITCSNSRQPPTLTAGRVVLWTSLTGSFTTLSFSHSIIASLLLSFM